MQNPCIPRSTGSDDLLPVSRSAVAIAATSGPGGFCERLQKYIF